MGRHAGGGLLRAAPLGGGGRRVRPPPKPTGFGPRPSRSVVRTRSRNDFPPRPRHRPPGGGAGVVVVGGRHTRRPPTPWRGPRRCPPATPVARGSPAPAPRHSPLLRWPAIPGAAAVLGAQASPADPVGRRAPRSEEHTS